mgnify:CR=1 FL=1
MYSYLLIISKSIGDSDELGLELSPYLILANINNTVKLVGAVYRFTGSSRINLIDFVINFD